MPKALVLGVNGQDGSYVAESLLRRSYQVVGTGRQVGSRHVPATQFAYVPLDLQDGEALRTLLHDVQPDVVFHAAAVHGAAGFEYEPLFAAMTAVNVVAVQSVLEFARLHKPKLRLVYANSAKIFPGPLSGTLSEQSRMASTCLYSIGKIAALELIRYYRDRHGIAGANLILFNHESPRRPPEYFMPILARGLAAAIADPRHAFRVRTLDFYADWSSAQELMDIAVDICELAPAEDFVLASGVTLHAREVAAAAFAQHGLDAARHIVEELPPTAAGSIYTVNVDRLQARIGRRPMRTTASLIDELVREAQASPPTHG